MVVFFDESGAPNLIGARCPQCGTYVFPPRVGNCPNPDCAGDELEPAALSRRGTVWSYTENRYQPPPPYPQIDPFEPFRHRGSAPRSGGFIVPGKWPRASAADLTVGMEMELTTMPPYTDDEGVERSVYAWRIVS